MSVHYKFKSALEFDTVTFDGLHISVLELKKSILHQKRIGKNTDFDLQITNAQTKEVYTDDNTLIPKNTSLIVARVPLTAQQKKAWERSESNQQPSGISKVDNLNGAEPGVHRLAKAADLSSLDASEEEKIQAMMTQSTQDYNPSNYIKIRNSSQVGDVPPNYRCHRCFQPGHWIKNCPLAVGQESIEIKKSTGIPRSFMVPVDGPSVPGAMMTPSGQFAVPAIDHQAYKEGKKEKPPFQQEPEPAMEKPEIPEDLLCTICKDLLTDAVMIPCCGNSFCDECIRMVLLESEDHECPDCCEKDVSPETLIPNRFLRNAVNNFKNETGYNKRPSTLKEVPLVTSVVQSMTTLSTNVPAKETVVPNEDLKVQTSSHTILNPSKNIIQVIGASSAMPVRSVLPSAVVTTSSSAPISHHQTSVPISHHQMSVPISHHQTSVPVPVSNGMSVSNNGSFNHANITTVARPIVTLAPPGVADVTTQSVSAPPVFHSNGSSHTTALLAPRTDFTKRHSPELQTVAPAPHLHPVDHLKANVGTAQDVPQQVFVQEIGKVEERPGTPTIDECSTDISVPITITSSFPDTSVPPPNFTGDTAFQQIQTRVGVPPAQSYRSEKPYIHRVNTQVLPALTVVPPVVRHTVSLMVPTPQPPPPAAGAYMPHPQYEHIPPPGFPVDTTVRPYPDGQTGQRGAYRGGYRGRGRGGFRGHLHNTYQQPLPPGVGGVRNENPPGTIDDPLEVFERMLREKDNRDRKLRNTRRSRSPRSLSRTRSRSRDKSASPRSYTPRSRTPTPPPRSRSVSRGRVARSPSPRPRSPPRKRSRTRSRSRTHSRSFTISRSRSHSFSRSLTPSPRHRSPLIRQYSPKRREEGSRYRSPLRTPPQPARFQRSYKDAPIEYEAGSSYYDNDYPPQYPSKRGGNFNDKGRGRLRKDYNKDYYNQNYNRYSENRYGSGRSNEEVRNRSEKTVPHPPVSTRYEPPSSYHHYDNYDILPPGTADIPIVRPYEKCYEHGYDRTGRKSLSPVDEYLAPPGVDVRPPEYSGRDRDVVLSSKDHDVVTSVVRDRNTRDIGIRDRDNQPAWDSKDRKVREQVNDICRERERDARITDRVEKSKDWGRDVYETDYRYGYDSRSYGYVSPDNRHRKQSVSPIRQGSGADRFSSVDKHRHRNDSHSSRRKAHQSHSTGQQSVEAVDVIDKHREFDNQRDDDRGRVIVELRRTTSEPLVAKVKKDKDDKPKKDDDKSKDRKSREKKRKKKEKDLDSDKTKKKKKDRKEKKDTKKDTIENKTLTKESLDEKVSIETEKSAVLKVIDTNKQIKEENAKTTKILAINEEPEASIINNNTKAKECDLPHKNDLYEGIEETKIDSNIIASYNTTINDINDKKDAEVEVETKQTESIVKDINVEKPENVEEPGSQILKPNDVLAPLPELSKWELEDDLADERIGEDKPGNSDGSDVLVTSEVLKRAENAIFQKAINAIRPNEGVKKPFNNSERKVSSGATEKEKKCVEPNVKDTSDLNKKLPDKEQKESKKPSSSIQVTIPIVGYTERSVELSSDGNGNKSKKLDRSKFVPSSSSWRDNLTSPHRVPAKERLGAKLDADDDRKEDRSHKYGYNRPSVAVERKHSTRKGLRSAVEHKRTKSRSRSPFQRKMFANRKDPKFVDYMKDAKYLETLEIRRYMEGERRVIDPGLEKKYFEQPSKRDVRYIEPERFACVTAVRDRHHIEQRGYSPGKKKDHIEGHDKLCAKREEDKSLERHKSKHKLKKKTKEKESRKKSVSDRESKRGKKKDKKHKKDKSKKQKKDDKITESNVSKDKGNSGHMEGSTKTESAPSKNDPEKSTLKKEDSHKNTDVEKKIDRKNPKLASDRKKSTLDEASFEPDYDASSSLDSDIEEVREVEKKPEQEEKKIEKSEDLSTRKHEKSKSNEEKTGKKHQKVEKHVDTDTNKSKKNSIAMKRREKASSSEEDSSDDSSEDESSSDSSSDTDESSDDTSSRRKKKKKVSKKHKRKKGKRSKRAETTSESESESDSDDDEDDSSSDSDSIPSRKRKHKHHSKSKKKKKKSRRR